MIYYNYDGTLTHSSSIAFPTRFGCTFPKGVMTPATTQPRTVGNSKMLKTRPVEVR